MTKPRVRSSRSMTSVIGLGLVTFMLSTVGWFATWVLVPTLLGWHSCVVISGSMMPLIRPGDVVLFPSYDHQLQAGEVVTFQSAERPGETVTHRLVRQNADRSWVTQGDANSTPDMEPLRDSAIIGRPHLLIPDAGMLTFWRYSGQDLKLAGTAIGVIFFLVVAVPRMGWRHNNNPSSQKVVLAEVVVQLPGLTDSEAR